MRQSRQNVTQFDAKRVDRVVGFLNELPVRMNPQCQRHLPRRSLSVFYEPLNRLFGFLVTRENISPGAGLDSTGG